MTQLVGSAVVEEDGEQDAAGVVRGNERAVVV